MPKFDLSISPDYLPKWGEWEGVREIVQNGLDEQTQHPEHSLSVRYWPESMRLEVHNEKARLPMEALLIGKTTKANDPNTIGQFGEGLKLGAMALVRKGLHVKVLNQDELWIAKLDDHKALKSKVLSFDISKNSSPIDGVTVVVQGIQPKQWESFSDNFLALRGETAKLAGDEGSILTDDSQRGRVYVKGVLVAKKEGLAYGYDLQKIGINRDRSIIDGSDLSMAITAVWCGMENAEALSERLLDLLLNPEALEFRGLFSSTGHFYFSPHHGYGKGIIETWEKRYGKDVLPAVNQEQLEKLRHFGKDAKLVPIHHGQFFNEIFGHISQRLKQLAETPRRVYAYEELEQEERDNLLWAIHQVQPMQQFISYDLPPVTVVDFADDNIRGMFRQLYNESENKMTYGIQLAKRILANRTLTLRVLVHEYAHFNGGDGTKEHVSTLEDSWQLLFDRAYQAIVPVKQAA